MTQYRLSAFTEDGRRFNPIWNAWYNDPAFLISMLNAERAKLSKTNEKLEYVDCIDFASEADMTWFMLRYS